MDVNVNVEALVYYLVFAVFVFYQQLHVKNFRGSSQSFQFLLSISAFAGMVTGIVFLAYYAIQVSIVGAVVIFAIGLLTGILGAVLERIISAHVLSLVGFIAWPVSAYLMFMAI